MEDFCDKSTVRSVDDILTQSLENFHVLVSMENNMEDAKKALYMVFKQVFFDELSNSLKVFFY